MQALKTKSPFLNESPSAPPVGAKRKEKGVGEKLFQRKYSLLNESPAARKRRGMIRLTRTFDDSRLTPIRWWCIWFRHCAGEFFVLGVPGGDGRGGMHAILAV